MIVYIPRSIRSSVCALCGGPGEWLVYGKEVYLCNDHQTVSV